LLILRREVVCAYLRLFGLENRHRRLFRVEQITGATCVVVVFGNLDLFVFLGNRRQLQLGPIIGGSQQAAT
jgi:hypothetical protein